MLLPLIQLCMFTSLLTSMELLKWMVFHPPQSLSRSLGIICLTLDLSVHNPGFLLWSWSLQKCSIIYVLAFCTGDFSQTSEGLCCTGCLSYTTTYCKWKHLERSNWNFQQTNMRKKRRGLEKNINHNILVGVTQSLDHTDGPKSLLWVILIL